MRKIFYTFMLIILSLATRAHISDYDYLPIKSIVDRNISRDYTTAAIFEECSVYNRTPYYNICVSPYYKDMLKRNSAAGVLKLAENDTITYSNYTSDCHFIGHEIGSQVYHNNNGSISASIKDCGYIWLCGGGCHHQIFIEYMDNKSVEEIVKARDLICHKKDNLPEDFEYTCYHSFGHAMALYFEYDLEKAKTFCEDLPEKYAYECLDGMHHQNYFRYLDMDFGDILKNLNLLCNPNMNGIDLKACYERAGKFSLTYYGYHNSQAFSKGLALCSKFDFVKRNRCLNGLLVFPENCDPSDYPCSFLIHQTKFINLILDTFSGQQ